MKRLHIIGMVLALVFSSAAWFPRDPVAAQDKPPRPLQKWEYKLVKVPPLKVGEMEADLNRLGFEGWELCTTVVPFRRAGEEYLVSFIFKRRSVEPNARLNHRRKLTGAAILVIPASTFLQAAPAA